MSDQESRIESTPREGELEFFDDNSIASANAKLPRWLFYSYFVVFAWGLASLILYFNGSHGWLDRGYWQQLQRAAHTTFPEANHMYPNTPKEPIVPPSELSLRIKIRV